MLVGKLAVGLAAVLAVGTGVAVANSLGSEQTLVAAIVDGDTIDVSTDGDIKRVRLLNVDAPESVHPDEFVQCMGPEATAFLEELLPVGTEVALAYDREKTDRYDRELAGVTVGDMLVNAEIARVGLGIAVLIEPNSRFYEEVRDAQLEAIAAGRGLYDEALGCTLPGRVAEVAGGAETVLDEPASVEDGLQAMESYSSVLAETIVGVAALTALLDLDVDGLYAVVHRHNAGPREALAQVNRRLENAQRTTMKAIQTEKDRIEAERLEAERLEAERLEAELREAERLEAERVAAQEQREREQREAERREAERRAAAQRPSGGSAGSGSGSGSSSGGSGSSGSGGYDGYTGCRAYGGNYPPNAIDEKGRPYTKIDCSTKRPIGG